ncbi:MAG: DUF928 domain-containing protein [Deltaproteobacteria bacterium]|nr:DUF928 domain-containing protein [Deltaproteobacteria bacterium]
MSKVHAARFAFVLCVVAVALAIADSKAQETGSGSETHANEKSANPEEPDAKAEPNAKSGSVPVFVPRDVGAPVARVGGGTRGIEIVKSPSIEVLAPERLGYTLDPQPTLYWSLSEATDRRVEIRVNDHGSDPPVTVFETVLEGPLESGVHGIDLALHGVTLKPGVVYMWYVQLNPRSDGRYSGGGIQRVLASAELEAALAAAAADRKAFVFAEAGIWYDAVDVLSEQIEGGAAGELALAQRTALLEQAGLPSE